MPIIHPDLKKAIKNNKLVVFAGSGTSIRCGFPDWKNLVIEILMKLDQKQGSELFAHFKVLMDKGVLSPLQVLNILEGKNTEIILEVLREKLIMNDDINLELQQKLIQLTSKVITSNYDKCFEAASGLSIQVINNDDCFSLWKLKDANEYIFKIHGDIDHPTKCILFEKQYEELYAKEAFWIGFMNLLMNSTVLFIGFSLSDTYVNSILIKIRQMYEGLTNKHFIITTDKHFEAYGLNDIIIPIAIDDYDHDLIQTLDELMPFVSNLPIRSYSKFVRVDKVVEIMKRLKENLPLIVIKGESGTGKKSLALEAGYACLQKSNLTLSERVRFNNVIWISSTEVKQDPKHMDIIFDIIGRAFNSEKVTKISGDERWKKDWEVYKLLQENRTLIIIDSFESLNDSDELLKWLQNLPETCKAIITTVKEIPVPASKIELDVLSRKEAVQLIKDELGNDTEALQSLTENELTDLFFYTKGNPRALQLTAGQIKQRTIDMNEIRIGGGKSALEDLHNRAWDQLLSENSKKFLLLFSVFTSFKAIDRDTLLDVCRHAAIDFETASKECDALNLLVISDHSQLQLYLIPPQSRAFTHQKLNDLIQKEIRNYWMKYFLEFVRANVIRHQPDEPYWNALVSDKMKALKKNWNGISEVLNWTISDVGHDKELIELTTLLVHYMDSRFYNQERLRIVNAAILAAKRLNYIFEEALFRIDALGWTYIEESSLDKAKDEIKQGILLAELLGNTDPLKAKDLIALGNAWLARAEIEQDNKKEAFEAMEKALTYRGKPWIHYRVYMAAGDIYVHEKRFTEALLHYEVAKEKYEVYGGEGQDYQINPRIALAYLRNNQKDNAQKILNAQLNEDIPIGNLYAEYGLALINYTSGKKEEAMNTLDEIEREIYRQTSSNVLLKLIKAFREEEIQNGLPA